MLRSGGDPDENKILEPLQMEQEKMADLTRDVKNRVRISFKAKSDDSDQLNAI